MNKNIEEIKECSKCGRKLPIERFRLVRGQFRNPYYLSQCKECEYIYQRKYLEEKNEIKFSDDLEMLIDIQYKKIRPERILGLSKTGISEIGTDEIFVRLMDCKNYYLSNYGRGIHYVNGKYVLLTGSYDNDGVLRYSVAKDTYIDGKWVYKRVALYVPQAVVCEFIVNPDMKNNTYIWHSGYNKEDNYYRNLYPLNQEQYRVVKNHFMKTGDDSEWFILNVINDMRFKPDDWSKRCMKPIMCGVGYRGSENVDCNSEAYLRWHDMMSRCYNEKFHKRQPQYKDCTVSLELHNFSNFKVWYDSRKYGNEPLDIDKDILFKGNTEYGQDTCCFVPHMINALFVNSKANRGDCPIGVHWDNDKGKYRASMAFMGESIKLGTFRTQEEAFERYKEYKEDFIKDIAEQYRGKIPDKVYQAMLNWEIEITD